MLRASLVRAGVFGSILLVWTAGSLGQASSTAKACAMLPTAELEAHFGAKVSAVRGSDGATVSMCSVDVTDRRRGADLTSRPAGPASLSVEQRFDAIRKQLERQGSQTRNFGSVGCFTDQLPIGGTKLPVATCFLDRGGYLSLSLRSEDPKQLSFEAVKALLEKAAARR